MQRVTLSCAFHVLFQYMLHTRVKLFILHLCEVKLLAEATCSLRRCESMNYQCSIHLRYILCLEACEYQTKLMMVFT
jgi:hypothetical protein